MNPRVWAAFLCLTALAGCVDSDPLATDASTSSFRSVNETVHMDDLYLQACNDEGAAGTGQYTNPSLAGGWTDADQSLHIRLDWDAASAPLEQIHVESIIGSSPDDVRYSTWGSPPLEIRFDADELHAFPSDFGLMVRGHGDGCPEGMPAYLATHADTAVDVHMMWNVGR